MKVVHLSNSDLSGGAAIACKRIVEAQVKNGIDSALLVQRKLSSDPKVYSTTTNLFSTLRYNVRFILDEGYIRLLTNQSRGRFSNPLIGADLADHPIVKSSDIINLHWINGGFLSLDTLKKLGKLGKPIVWTLHDMWAFTGGCHYSLDCRKFESSCGNCPSLKFSGEKDASNKIFSHKIFFSELNLTIVTCSKWLKQETEKSLILGQKRVENIPNPIDTEIYQKYDTSTTRRKLGLADEKFYILFGAMNTKDERKGFKFLIESLKSLTSETESLKNSIEVLIFGKTDNKNLSEIPFKCHYFGQFKRVEQIVDCYNSANIFIAPSLQDNLPNTVLESLSCGTPVVSFNVGGMSDMIEHLKNGYLAEANSVTDLKNGIKWFLENRVNPDQLKFNSREKVVKNFSQEVVAKKYKELYTSLIY